MDCIEALMQGQSPSYLQELHSLNDRAMAALLVRVKSHNPMRLSNCMPLQWWRPRTG